MSKQKRMVIRIILSFMGAIFLGLLCYSNLFLRVANNISDAFYQRPQVPNENIILVGMDERATADDAFGPMPWTRDVMAQAVAYLNSDPEKRPAVIGLDTLFVGESDIPEYDEMLAKACGAYGNVVTATTATFGNELVISEDGSFYMDDYSVLFYEEPFEELREVTTQGHINAMIDEDGILRHAIWQIELADGTMVPSFHQSIYQKYMEFMGLEADYVPAMDVRYRWYVPFSSEPTGYDSGYSVLDLVNGTADLDVFKDKIVLIGPYTQGMTDEYITAIDHATKMFGVEYQANAIAALLDEEVKVEILSFPQAILVFLVSFLLLLWFYNRRFWLASLVWFGITIAWILFCLIAWELGYVWQVIYIPIATTMSYILSVGVNYTKEAMDKRKVTNTFRRYVAPEIVSELLNDPQALELGGKTVNVAVLFVDVRGFTSMSEALDPVQVVEIINRCLSLTSECIFNNGGTLDKFIGDCAMAFWGAPIAQEDGIYKAVKAAMDMVEKGDVLSKELEQEYGYAVHFGVGVHYGPAVVGNIGSKERMDYTVIGDTVNTAARLESNAPKGCIYVSKVVANALEGRIQFRSLGNSIKLKGKSDSFEVFQVEN